MANVSDAEAINTGTERQKGEIFTSYGNNSPK